MLFDRRHKKHCRKLAAILIGAILFSGVTTLFAVEPSVLVRRVPGGGILPQVAKDVGGTLHMIYFKGEAKAGNIFYVWSKDDGKTYSDPIRVNSEPNSAVAVGTIRGPHMFVGRNGRVHVAWNGSGTSETSNKKDAHAIPMLYARLNDAGAAFESQRNLMTNTHALDGGGSIAADAEGRVYVVWHGITIGMPISEQNRAVFVARSDDDGKSFTPEKQANTQSTGACGCCGMRASVDATGRLFLFYRSAEKVDQRDMRLLVSSDHGKTFINSVVDRLSTAQCPMSSAMIFNGTTLAWETGKEVYFQPMNLKTLTIEGTRHRAPSQRGAKHPTIVVNTTGQSLLVWAEGTGWNRGGSLAWQIYSDAGQSLEGASGRIEGIPAWSYATAFVRADGGFVIVY